MTEAGLWHSRMERRRRPQQPRHRRECLGELVQIDGCDHEWFEERGPRCTQPADDPNHDRSLAIFRDRIFDARGQPTHMFWEAAPSEAHPDGFRSQLLPAITETMTAHAVEARYQIADPERIARITARLRIRPMGMDVLQDLVDSGDLDPALLAEVPTFTLHGAAVEWRQDEPELRSLLPDALQCPQAYLCLLEPKAPECD